MSDINPSLVSSELTTIETFKDTTEKRGSKLTLNELNYISDKQLHQKTDGGGSGDSSVGLADVRFVADNLDLSLGDVFSNGPAVWGRLVDSPLPGHPFLFTDDHDYNVNIGRWNAGSETAPKFVAPFIFGIIKPSYLNLVTVSSGNAEIIEVEGSKVLYVTGDCTITIGAGGK